MKGLLGWGGEGGKKRRKKSATASTAPRGRGKLWRRQGKEAGRRREPLAQGYAALELLPETLLRDGGDEVEPFPRDGMGEGDASGEETDAGVGIATRGAVLEIASDRATQGSELATDLMVSAGM